MFADAQGFPAVGELAGHWRAIRDEYLAVQERARPWVEDELFDGQWQTLGLFDFPHGERIADNCADCPVTAGLVERLFPRHGAAGFSVLQPGTDIHPHCGYQGDFLRCHLGLVVPPGDCALEVEGQPRHWQEGEAFVFDDRVLHRAWNHTQSARVVLLVDFVPYG